MRGLAHALGTKREIPFVERFIPASDSLSSPEPPAWRADLFLWAPRRAKGVHYASPADSVCCHVPILVLPLIVKKRVSAIWIPVGFYQLASCSSPKRPHRESGWLLRCKHCFRFCNRSIQWWMINPVSFTRVPVGQSVSG